MDAAVFYLFARGDSRAALPIAEELHTRMLARRGADDIHTLNAALNLGVVYWQIGRYEQARQLDEDTLTRRRVLGEDHPGTQRSMRNLAEDVRLLGKTPD